MSLCERKKDQDDLSIACSEIANTLTSHSQVTKDEIDNLKRVVCQKYHLERYPSNSMILAHLSPEKHNSFKEILKIKPVRTASGIAVIAVMTKPYPCAHGACIYCPGGHKFSTPQSYTGQEPAALRGTQNDFDPFRQVSARLDQLRAIGHDVEKAEIIIMGGTFLNFQKDYQKDFIKRCYDALNYTESKNLAEAKRNAEHSKIRNVGLTIETRPDFCKEEHVDLMLNFGVTRIEIGVQNPDDIIYKIVKRGHHVKDVVSAFRIAKDSAFKIVAHMMPGLPGSNPDKDFDAFQRLFNDPEFKPDMLKIYPTLLVESSELYRWFLDGRYLPYDDETTIKLLAKVKSIVPSWVRIMRIQRDIPARLIVAGVKKSNLRELVQKELSKIGNKCKCIRCREVGIKKLKYGIDIMPENIRLLRQDYEASNGFEVFLSYEDVGKDALIGFLRLRHPSDSAHRDEIKTKRSCLVRELHVYGKMIPIGKRSEYDCQHKGFGAMLMEEAERIAKDEFGSKKLVVMSAIGTKEYYRKLGYKSEGAYMVKNI
ncbi:MAG: tRNA uridine(34) 5-carboxymethylaminomethyl modification radical SAM/GNAT enzyme Elp3 [Candidatus Methylarchaceae archaeon HK02M2]|nr:tRNA uridine(34) 5-carboxymethylaminomethyl modification radical SAM/GNAT enzyme Elp3 [Candidatus Methylarchaceae archaeon HK02M2]